jgi:hypothetical protein
MDSATGAMERTPHTQGGTTGTFTAPSKGRDNVPVCIAKGAATTALVVFGATAFLAVTAKGPAKGKFVFNKPIAIGAALSWPVSSYLNYREGRD